MIDKKMEEALNKQVNAEMYSSYLYLAMAQYFESKNLRGCAAWMGVQSQEEMGHAMKFVKYINDRGGRVKLDKIDKPKGDWKGILDVFTDTLAHEKKVTALIHGLVETAAGLKDHASSIFLQWFVTEQVEEEANVELIIHQVGLAGEEGRGLFLIDHELGKRAK